MSDRYGLAGVSAGPLVGPVTGPRVLAYSHDGYGLGHVRRNLRIVNGLRRQRPDVQAMLVTGARSAERLVAASDVRCTPLPAVVKVANGRYVADGGATSPEGVIRTRAAIIARAVRDFRPDLLLVDRYPRGMGDELVGGLQVLADELPGALAVLGLRDILDSPGVIVEEWRANGYSGAIRETYASVLCYGDPRVYDPVSEYGLPRDVADRIVFTGYLADGLLVAEAAEVRHRHVAAGGRLAVCTLGGGKDAAHIAHAFLSAIELLRGDGWTGVLITGPYMASVDLDRLACHPGARWTSILQMVDDVPSYLAAADAAVCMGGYNTTCELLALAVPAVVVPRVHPRQEQLMRAERLGARGLVWWLHPSYLTPGALAWGIERAAARPRAELAERLGGLARYGIHAAAEHLAGLLPAAEPAVPGGRAVAEVAKLEPVGALN